MYSSGSFRCCRINGNVIPVDHKPPTTVIESAHREKALPFHDTTDFNDAGRGFIAALPPCVIKAADGRVVWDTDAYGFLGGTAPTSVHPSLWRQSTLAARQGLYEVVPGIYQVRGFDISNVTFVEGDTGIIVIDPLISTEVAAAALGLYRAHRGGDRPVVAVIYTHSHVDHFGGVLGVTAQADVDAGAVAVLAPEGFIEHAVQENVYAGPAMPRRATYMYGPLLPRGPKGQVGCGLGQAPSTGEVALIVPTLVIRETGEKHTIDGVEIEFQMAPGTEAPAGATRARGRATSPRPSTPSPTGPMWCSLRTTGRPGDETASSNSFRCNAICTPTCTTRRYGCSTRATPVWRSPKCSGCRPRWKRPSTRMGIT